MEDIPAYLQLPAELAVQLLIAEACKTQNQQQASKNTHQIKWI